jgi:hypothetical protein
MTSLRTRIALVVFSSICFVGCGDDSASTPDMTSPLDPWRIALVPGYQPESIVKGPGNTVYLGVLTGGGVEQVDLDTHVAKFVVQPLGLNERVITGVAYQAAQNQIWACGGWLSNAFVFDANSGATLATIQFPPMSMINDVKIRGATAYFSDSALPNIYTVAIAANGLPAGPPQVVPLTGDFVTVPGLQEANSNGILPLPGSSDILIVNSAAGVLYKVDSTTGVAKALNMSVPGADGLFLADGNVYVVQNTPTDTVTILSFDANFTAGTIVKQIADPIFDSPSDGLKVGADLWIVNSRLGSVFHGEAQPSDKFELVRIQP